MVVSYCEVNSYFKLDDIVWACAFELTTAKGGKHNYSKPVRGMLVAGSTEVGDKNARKKEERIRFFVPFKKNGDGLAWSKAVTIYSRYFADTEEESKECYNSQVQEVVTWLETRLDEVKKEFI